MRQLSRLLPILLVLLLPFSVFAAYTFTTVDDGDDTHFADINVDVSHWSTVTQPGDTLPSAGQVFTSTYSAWCSGAVIANGTYGHFYGLGSGSDFQLDPDNGPHTSCNWSLFGSWTVSTWDGGGVLIESVSYNRVEPEVPPVSLGTTSTSTPQIGDIVFGLYIIIILLFIAVFGFIFNTLSGTKIWE